jgi:hypothetical protein
VCSSARRPAPGAVECQRRLVGDLNGFALADLTEASHAEACHAVCCACLGGGPIHTTMRRLRSATGPRLLTTVPAGAALQILSAGSAGALIGGIVSYRLTPARPLLTARWFVCLGATPQATLAIPAPTWVIAFSMLIAGGGALVFNTLWETTLQRHVAPDRLSRVSAYDYLGSFIAKPLGLALMGHRPPPQACAPRSSSPAPARPSSSS